MSIYDVCIVCGYNANTHEHDKIRWIGVDFDGTLAYSLEVRGPYDLGEPIPNMVKRVRGWLDAGYTVKLFTARMNPYSATTKQNRDVEKMRTLLEDWCFIHLGERLECVNAKDGAMEVLWDDRAVEVKRDEGIPAL